MGKDIIFNIESRDALKRGVDALANAVKVTLGPQGRNPITLKVGDTVLYSKYGGTELQFQGEDFLIMRESDILAIINK